MKLILIINIMRMRIIVVRGDAKVAKILIAYASMSGNTESIADLIKVSLGCF